VGEEVSCKKDLDYAKKNYGGPQTVSDFLYSVVLLDFRNFSSSKQWYLTLLSPKGRTDDRVLLYPSVRSLDMTRKAGNFLKQSNLQSLRAQIV
jgi:hypothetical protein